VKEGKEIGRTGEGIIRGKFGQGDEMALSAGTKLGPYEIGGPLGAGGMGEVYRAKDTRLGRDVAIKVLPESFVADAAARQRFEREAKSISGLNHPNICVLYDVGHQDGMEYLVMEYVEGETLAKRLEKGPLPLEQVLKYGSQIAEALDKAHRSGIVHRDLKPGNVMLTSTGAKLLDFGLAKESAGLTSLATITATSPASPVTQQGTIVGTFQYMSPEQIEGKPVDGRSDIFSLGGVLYEMLTGKRAFEGKTQLSVASAILEREPLPLRELKPITPATLERAIQRCLAKDPEERWQAARDLALELNWIGKTGATTTTTEAPAIVRPAKRSLLWMLWPILGAAALGVLAGAIFWKAEKPAAKKMTFTAPLPFSVRDMQVAPNGHTVAVVSHAEGGRKGAIWIYELGSEESRTLVGTEGATFPFWAPDGNALGFFAEGKLRRIDLPGGTVQTLADAPAGRGGTWSKDGVILFTPTGRLRSEIWRVPAAGGTAQKVVEYLPNLGGGSQRWPQFLPDGKHFLFLSATIAFQGEKDGIYAGSLDSQDYHMVVNTFLNGEFIPPDLLLYVRDKTLQAQKLDLKTQRLVGEPWTVASDVGVLPRIMHAVFSGTDTNSLVYQKGAKALGSRLTWFDRSGKPLGTLGDAGVYSNPKIDGKGRMVAYDKTDPGNLNTDVWTYDLQTGDRKRLTFDPALDATPMWSPDDSQIVFTSSRGPAFNLFVKKSDGAQEEKTLVESIQDKYPNSWSKDGKYILFMDGAEVKYLTLPEKKVTPFLKVAGTARSGQISPDGKWVAYASNESGKWEVYVTSFPDAKGKWQISNGGGEEPRWRNDGKEMFYLSSDWKLMAAEVKTAGGFDASTPTALFQVEGRESAATSEQYMYDVSPDGQKILVNALVKGEEAPPMTVLLGWGEK
jgi:eukaryotic-like serine/threonine-protein kinase